MALVPTDCLQVGYLHSLNKIAALLWDMDVAWSGLHSSLWFSSLWVQFKSNLKFWRCECKPVQLQKSKAFYPSLSCRWYSIWPSSLGSNGKQRWREVDPLMFSSIHPTDQGCLVVQLITWLQSSLVTRTCQGVIRKCWCYMLIQKMGGRVLIVWDLSTGWEQTLFTHRLLWCASLGLCFEPSHAQDIDGSYAIWGTVLLLPNVTPIMNPIIICASSWHDLEPFQCQQRINQYMVLNSRRVLLAFSARRVERSVESACRYCFIGFVVSEWAIMVQDTAVPEVKKLPAKVHALGLVIGDPKLDNFVCRYASCPIRFVHTDGQYWPRHSRD